MKNVWISWNLKQWYSIIVFHLYSRLISHKIRVLCFLFVLCERLKMIDRMIENFLIISKYMSSSLRNTTLLLFNFKILFQISKYSYILHKNNIICMIKQFNTRNNILKTLWTIPVNVWEYERKFLSVTRLNPPSRYSRSRRITKGKKTRVNLLPETLEVRGSTHSWSLAFFPLVKTIFFIACI